MPSIPRIPLPWTTRTLTPASAAIPANSVTLQSRITAGLPHSIALDSGVTLGLVAPTGLARYWVRSEPDEIVADAKDTSRTVPFRLLLREGARLMGVVPLVLGPARFVGESAQAPPRIRLVLLDWRIHAGSLRGPGDLGSFVTLAWRRVGAGSREFTAPIARIAVRRRLERQPVHAGGPSATDARGLGAERDCEPGAGSGQAIGYGRRFADD